MQEFPELVPPTNPETYLTSKCPPFFIQHGMKHALPYLQAEKFADKLRKKIGDGNVELVLLPDVGGGDDPNYFTKENTQRKVDFLNRIFKKEK